LSHIPREKQKALFPLLWIMLFDHTSLNLVFPVLTLLFFDADSRFFAALTPHDIRSYWYGLCIAIPHAVNFFSAPLLGMLSDQFGRRNILLLAATGALAYALTGAFSVLAGSMTLLFCASLLRGLFSRTNPIAQAAIGDISPPQQRNKKMLYMGYLQTAISLGAFAGPILGGRLARSFDFAGLNFSLPFFAAAGFAVMALGLTFFTFSETLQRPKNSAGTGAFHWKPFLKLFADKRIQAISLILLLSQVGWSLYYQFMPPILKMLLHADARQIGQFVGLIALWLALATLFGIRLLSEFFNMRGILIFSLWLMFAGLALTLFFFIRPALTAHSSLPWVAAILVAAGDVIAFSCICTLYSDAVSQEDQGKIMGMGFIVISAVWMLSAVLGGLLLALHPLLPLAVALPFVLAGIGFVCFMSELN